MTQSVSRQKTQLRKKKKNTSRLHSVHCTAVRKYGYSPAPRCLLSLLTFSTTRPPLGYKMSSPTICRCSLRLKGERHTIEESLTMKNKSPIVFQKVNHNNRQSLIRGVGETPLWGFAEKVSVSVLKLYIERRNLTTEKKNQRKQKRQTSLT